MRTFSIISNALYFGNVISMSVFVCNAVAIDNVFQESILISFQHPIIIIIFDKHL